MYDFTIKKPLKDYERTQNLISLQSCIITHVNRKIVTSKLVQSILVATVELATLPSRVGDLFQSWVKEDPFHRRRLKDEFWGLGLEDGPFH